MAKIYKIILIPCFVFVAFGTYAQGKYFEVVFDKPSAEGKVIPFNNQEQVKLDYNGKSKKQLLIAVSKYLKERPGLKLDNIPEDDGTYLVYRDFATIGTKDKCLADLVASTLVYVTPENGHISIRLSLTSKIYASIFDAKLRISPDGTVGADDDKPFNEYKFVQPNDGKTQSKISPNGGLLGAATSGKINYKLAYPDSIFDPDGKIVNLTNKQIIEKFYDGYVIDLKNYLDKNLK